LPDDFLPAAHGWDSENRAYALSAAVASSSTPLACKRGSWDPSPFLVCNVEEAAMLVTAIAPSGTELKQIELGDNAVLS
jgi:hypothetical protein